MPRGQLRQLFVDLALRTSAANYRGCPFVNIAVEFPDRSPVGADGGPQTVKRAQTVVWTEGPSSVAPNGGNGTALMRPLGGASLVLLK